MNYLFTVRHKKTEREVAVYGVTPGLFLVWSRAKNRFAWADMMEFERIESANDYDYYEE